MEQAVNYRRWIFSKIEPFLGKTILEVGGGIGNYTVMYPVSSSVVTVEPHPDCAAYLRKQFNGTGRVAVSQTDLDGYQSGALFESIVCLNVLEHIGDDLAAIKKMASLLLPGGKLLLLLPAGPALFGSIDHALQHVRRYDSRQAQRLIESSGLRLVCFEHMNMVGYFGWFINARLLKKSHQSTAQVVFYDRVIVPLLRKLESALPPPFGQSIFILAEAPHSKRL